MGLRGREVGLQRADVWMLRGGSVVIGRGLGPGGDLGYTSFTETAHGGFSNTGHPQGP